MKKIKISFTLKPLCTPINFFNHYSYKTLIKKVMLVSFDYKSVFLIRIPADKSTKNMPESDYSLIPGIFLHAFWNLFPCK